MTTTTTMMTTTTTTTTRTSSAEEEDENDRRGEQKKSTSTTSHHNWIQHTHTHTHTHTHSYTHIHTHLFNSKPTPHSTNGCVWFEITSNKQQESAAERESRAVVVRLTKRRELQQQCFSMVKERMDEEGALTKE